MFTDHLSVNRRRQVSQRRWLVTSITAMIFMAGCNRNEPIERTTSGTSTIEDSTGNSANIRFRDVAESNQIHFTYRNGFEGLHFGIIQSLGGGCAISDIDCDGYPDLLMSGGGHFRSDGTPVGLSGALYRNVKRSGFEDITTTAGFETSKHYSHGVATADYNNDGFPDALITGYGGVVLLENQGDGTFHDVTEECRLNDQLWSSSAAWGDINGDGSLDLYIAHYVDWSPTNNPVCLAGSDRELCPPRQFSGLTDSLFISSVNGDFRSAGTELGLVKGGKGLGVVIADIDLNGDLDVYVTNDTEPNFHYLYDQMTEKLVESAIRTGTGIGANGSSEGSMGCDVADFDRDGLPDIWVANYQGESFSLHRNSGNNVFFPAGRQTGVDTLQGLYVGWGTLFCDFDHDLDEDIFVTTGHVILYPTESTVAQQPLILENQNGKKFRDITSKAGDYLNSSHEGRGLAAGDLDLDGDLDLAISHLNAPVSVLENVTENNSQWLMIKLVGQTTTRDPIGSRVAVKTADGTLVRQLKGGGSYASTSDTWLHFGLGPHKSIDDATVTWRSGLVTHIGQLKAGSRYVIRELEENAWELPTVDSSIE